MLHAVESAGVLCGFADKGDCSKTQQTIATMMSGNLNMLVAPAFASTSATNMCSAVANTETHLQILGEVATLSKTR